MMTELHRQVTAFMVAFNQERRETPGMPSERTLRLRARLTIEEAFELVQAMLPPAIYAREVAHHKATVLQILADRPLLVDLPKVIDALGDLDYVNEGFRIAVGVYGPEIADRIHASNMKKTEGYLDAHGKWCKPADWVAPDIEGALRAQGWKGGAPVGFGWPAAVPVESAQA